MSSSVVEYTTEELSPISQEYLEDFCACYNREEDRMLEHRLEKLEDKFFKLDGNSSGDLDLEQATNGMTKICKELKRPQLTKQELLELMSLCDVDNTGTLTYREFINMALILMGEIDDPVPPRPPSGGKKQSLTNKIGCLLGISQPLIAPYRALAIRRSKRGHIQVKIKLSSAGSKKLEVEIISAKDLTASDFNGLSDPFAEVFIHGLKTKKQRTQTIRKNLNPVWNEKMSFDIPSIHFQPEDLTLRIMVYDWDRLTSNDFLGACAFPFEDIINPEIQTNGWFNLLNDHQGARYFIPSREEEIAELSAPNEAKMRKVSLTFQSEHSPEDFKFLKMIGKGNFGKVFLAEEKKSKQLFAVKVLKKLAVIQGNDSQAVMSERLVLARNWECEFLLNIYESFQTPANLYFVMDMINGGDLLFHLEQRGTFSEAYTAFYIAEISWGIMFLHDNGILHRDIKLDNILVDANGHIRICDFGLAKTGLFGGAKTRTFCGTMSYLSPEVVRHEQYGFEVDWWCLGVVMYILLSGTFPFSTSRQVDTYKNIVKMAVQIPKGLSAVGQQVLLGLLEKKPKKRLGSNHEEFKAHQFFKRFNWEKLAKQEERPPFQPTITDPRKASNFDDLFTRKRPQITPTDPSALDRIAEFDDCFEGFSFSLAKAKLQKPSGSGSNKISLV